MTAFDTMNRFNANDDGVIRNAGVKICPCSFRWPWYSQKTIEAMIYKVKNLSGSKMTKFVLHFSQFCKPVVPKTNYVSPNKIHTVSAINCVVESCQKRYIKNFAHLTVHVHVLFRSKYEYNLLKTLKKQQ